MATAGQPLPSRLAVCLWKAQTLQGTAITPDTAAGIVPFRVTSDSGMQRIVSIGSAAPIMLKPGICAAPFSLPIQRVQNGDLLAKIARSSGTLPWLTLAFGYVDDASTKYQWQVQDCKLDKAEIALEAGGFLSANLSGTGGLITELSGVSGLTGLNLADTPFMSYEGVFTKGGVAYECRSCRISIDNNITVDTVIPGTAPSTFKRGWSYQTEGSLHITGEITAFSKTGINLQADTISNFTLQLVCTDIVGGMSPNSITIACTGAKFGQETIEAELEGKIMFTTPFEATGLTVSNV